MPFCSTFAQRLRLELVVVDQLAPPPRRSAASAPRRCVSLRGLRRPRPAAGTCPGSAGQVLHAGRRHDLHAPASAARPRSRSPCRRARPRAASCGTSGACALSLRRAPASRPKSTAARRRQQHVEHALLGGVRARARDLRIAGFARLLDRDLDEVADDGVDVAADVADLGELGRLDLDERRVGEPRQPARDLGLADAGRPDHQDVLRRDLLAQRLGRPAGGASGCAARSRPRAWRGPGRRCACRARRRFPGGSSGCHARTRWATCTRTVRRAWRRRRARSRQLGASQSRVSPASRWCGAGWCRCRGRRRSPAPS